VAVSWGSFKLSIKSGGIRRITSGSKFESVALILFLLLGTQRSKSRRSNSQAAGVVIDRRPLGGKNLSGSLRKLDENKLISLLRERGGKKQVLGAGDTEGASHRLFRGEKVP